MIKEFCQGGRDIHNDDKISEKVMWMTDKSTAIVAAIDNNKNDNEGQNIVYK